MPIRRGRPFHYYSLQKSLIEDLKHIATLNGIGYQPLIRQILTRFADAEKKRILREAATARPYDTENGEEALSEAQKAPQRCA